MPTDAEPSFGPEKAPRASMTSLPLYVYAVASGKMNRESPLPTRFWTTMLRGSGLLPPVVWKSKVRNVSTSVRMCAPSTSASVMTTTRP